ncbi:disulfide bond formation protein B [Palleronia sp. KMU-117]|uniref:disulfide bond formation protein B n=1 Tax=Palleronia sp. KMU-117 TaxID=3434108 RepID=UPI003D7308CC
MTRRALILLAAGGSLAMLLGAWGFQYIAGLAPCAMCYWQRWPHMAAVAIGALGLAAPAAALTLAGALSALTTAGIGLYHTGVERTWWAGPSTCTSGDISGLSTQDLMDQILAAPLVRCDEVAWAFAGLSMASWNAVISLGLAAVWLMAWRAVR